MTGFDPTKINLTTDPTVQRFRGVTVHGNIPFDCPFITHVEDNIYVGGCEAGLVLPQDIEHLVSLYMWEKYKEAHEIKTSLTVKMYDSRSGFNEDQVLEIANWVAKRAKEGKVLVHCQAGLNRSPLIVATALKIMHPDRPRADIVNMLRTKRSMAVLCNRKFLDWFMKTDRLLSHS